MNFRTQFNRGKSTGQVFELASLTQQHSKSECDINQIIAKYRTTGIVSHVSGRRPMYGDFTAIGNFQDIQAKVLFAEDSFAQLPSNIRRRFNNDPSEFLSFVQNPANQAEAEALGMVQKPPKTPDKAEPASVRDPGIAAVVAASASSVTPPAAAGGTVPS